MKELLIEGGELAEGFYNFTVPSRHNEMHEIEMNPKRGLFFITPSAGNNNKSTLGDGYPETISGTWYN